MKLKKKWKYLRDQYAIEISKIKKSKSGDAASEIETSKWPHFKLLHFLKDIVKPRALGGNPTTDNDVTTDPLTEVVCQPDELGVNLNPQLAPHMSVNDDELSDDETDTSLRNETTENNSSVAGNPQPVTNSLETTQSGSGPVKHREKRTFKDEILALEQQKTEMLREKLKKGEMRKNVDDDDVHFLKSLLPHIKMIPQHTKLSFRSKVHEVVERFAYPSTCYQAESPSSYSSTSNPECNIVYNPMTTVPTNNSDDTAVNDVLRNSNHVR